MGIFDSLYTGVSGLNAAQIQIQVTGQNITNVNSDYYTRQRVVQSAAYPGDFATAGALEGQADEPGRYRAPGADFI